MQEDLSSNGKARLRNTVADDLIQFKRDRRKQFGINRQNASGIGSIQSIKSKSGNTSGNENKDSFARLKTEGDTMIGPIAFYPADVSITSNAIDISSNTSDHSTNVLVLGSSPSPGTDLNTITGARFAGQLLILQAVATTYVTLKHNVDNILVPGGSDYTVGDGENVILKYDSSSSKWRVIANFNDGSAGGDDLGNHTITQDLLPDTDNTHDLGSATKRMANVYSVQGTFNTISSSTTASLLSPVFLGNTSADVITFTGTTTDIIPKTNNTEDLGSSGLRWRRIYVNALDLGSGFLESSIIPDTTNSYDLGSAGSRFRDLYLTDDIEMNGVGSNINNAGSISTTTLTVSSTALLNGPISLGNSTGDNITVTGRISSDFDPNANKSRDLGSSGLRWAKLWGESADFDNPGADAITISDGDIDLASSSYIEFGSTSGTAGAQEGYLWIKIPGGSFKKIPYHAVS